MLLSDGAIMSDARVVAEAKSLIKNGYNVTVIAWDRKGNLKKKEEYEEIKIERIHLKIIFPNYACIYSSNLVLHLILFNINLFFTLLSKNFDIIHCHDFDTLIAGFFVGKLKGKKVVYDSHEIYGLMIKPHMPKIVGEIVSIVDFFLIKKVDAFITVSEILADYFKERVGGKVNISVIMNCKDPDDFKIPKKEVAELKVRLGIENRFIMLYDGWLIPDNGLEELFSAIQKLNGQIGDMMAVICGDGYAEEEFKKIVKEKNIENYVKFVGKIQSRDIPLFVSACDTMYVIRKPTVKYNFFSTPNRLFEAMIAGKPVIASNFGNVKRIVEKGGFGLLVNLGDITELCSALLTLRYDNKINERLSEKAKFMSRTYNWPFMEKRLLSLYESLTLQT